MKKLWMISILAFLSIHCQGTVENQGSLIDLNKVHPALGESEAQQAEQILPGTYQIEGLGSHMYWVRLIQSDDYLWLRINHLEENDLDIYLYDESLQLYASSAYGLRQPGLTETVTARMPGIYYLKVINRFDRSTSYELECEVRETNVIYPLQIASAQDLPAGDHRGFEIAGQREQVYRINLYQGQLLTVEPRTDCIYISAYLYDGLTRKKVARWHSLMDYTISDVQASFDTYYLVVSNSYIYPDLSSYDLVVTVSDSEPPGCQNDRYDSDQLNDDIQSAVFLQFGNHTDLKICPRDQDWFEVRLETGKQLDLELSHQVDQGALHMSLFDQDQQLLAQAGSANPHIVHQAYEPEVLFVRVKGAYTDVENDYGLRAEVSSYTDGCHGLIQTAPDYEYEMCPSIWPDSSLEVIGRSGTGSALFRFKVEGRYGSDVNLNARLQSPEGMNYDLICYPEGHPYDLYAADFGPGGTDSVSWVHYENQDAYYLIDIRYMATRGSEHCLGQWTLELEGDYVYEQYAQDCESDQVACDDGQCIPQSWLCDNWADCAWGEDEANCADDGHQDCDSSEYACLDGQCIPPSYLCDGYYDCVGYEDEADCDDGSQDCDSSEYTCLDGQCIPGSYQCDGYYDCVGYEDEADCEDDGSQECDSSEYACFDGQCIPLSYLCDGIVDCTYEEDELGC